MLPPHHRSAAIITNVLFSSASLPIPSPPSLSHLFILFAAAISFFSLIKSPFSLLLPLPPPFLSFLQPPPHRRRLIPLPMDRTATTAAAAPAPSDPLSLAFSSPESLAEWLNHRLPPGSLASWGAAPGTKTLHNLWLELAQGETTLLLQQPPLRAVHVATVRVRNPRGALLLESHQLLSDGTARTRLRPLSEKMRPGESVEEAALRAIREELGAVALAAQILPGSVETRVEERSSASYPGLLARYVLHSVDAQVEGLPEEGEFSTEEVGEFLEAQEEKAIFVRRHFWKWVDDDGGSSHLHV